MYLYFYIFILLKKQTKRKAKQTIEQKRGELWQNENYYLFIYLHIIILKHK